MRASASMGHPLMVTVQYKGRLRRYVLDEQISAKSNIPRLIYCSLTISSLSAVSNFAFDRKWIQTIARTLNAPA